MTEVDVRGLSCPIPVVRTMKAMEENPEDVLTVLVEDASARDNVSRMAEGKGYSVRVDNVSGEYHMVLTPHGR